MKYKEAYVFGVTKLEVAEQGFELRKYGLRIQPLITMSR